MALDNLNQLDSTHLDVLREIGNIGSGNAATSLASMLGLVVDIEVPQISLIDYETVAAHIGEKDEEALSLCLGLTGDINGVMLHVVKKDFVEKIINGFYPKTFTTLKEMDDMDLSALREVSNITTAAYINSISEMTQSFMNITPPEHKIATVYEVVSHAADSLSAMGSQVLYIDESLLIGGERIKSSMIMILDVDSLKLLFTKLGISF